ncbi:MAG: hypothetical protein RQ990_07475 [Candidatus Hydrothermia bacterium]|jgi:hypothetical protein|nr:hypothetical protein [Candidatus Hydrothermia bacterium]
MGPSILSNIDYFYVSKALLNYGLNINDLGYKKDISVETNLKPKGFIEILKRPFKIDTIAFKLLQKNIFLEIETILNDYYNLNITGPYSIVFNPDTLFSSFDIKIQNTLIKFIQASKIYSFYLEHSNVSLDEIESLIKFAKDEILSDSSNVSKDSVISYLSKLNFKNFFYANLVLLNAFLELKEAVKSLKGKDINFLYETEFGKIVITDSLMPSDSDFIYINTKGSQNYKKVCQSNIRICAFIDLEGNDKYELDNYSIYSEYGAVFFYDNEGDDIYKCSDFCLSSTILGISYFEDKSGDDIYDVGRFSISSSFYGISIFIEDEGDDIYRAVNRALSFSSIWGISIFQDLKGNDMFFLGRFYEHEPLWKNEFYGFGLGFSIGIREDIAGGFSYFVDYEGNDLYNCGTYCIGSAYWYSTGIFIDSSGNDRYIGVEYGLGAGIHIAIGSFFDLSGNDIYIFKAGPSIGSGHDFSIGFFYEKSGNDIYYVSGGIGNSIANGLGIFIDNSGNDSYNFTEYHLSCGASQNLSSQRDFFGIGLFIDISGNDNYPSQSKCKNNSFWRLGDIGIGYDGE